MIEPREPTIARAVPAKNDLAPRRVRLPKPATRWLPQIQLFAGANRGLAYERFSKRSKGRLRPMNIPTACPPRTAVLVNRGRGFTSVFHLSPSSFVFSQGCDHSGYVAAFMPKSCREVNGMYLILPKQPASCVSSFIFHLSSGMA
jgi:hypothetical protein